MLKNLCCIAVFLAICTQLSAQINGLSASKLNAFHTTPIVHKEAELEPTWNYMRSNGPEGSDSTLLETNLSWRMTYGIAEGAEIGFNAPSDFSSFCFSAKAQIYQRDKIALGLMAGAGFNFENGIVAPDQSLLSYYAGGLIVSYELDGKNTIDANIQAYKNTGGGSSNILMTADWGSYLIGEKFQFIISTIYSHSSESKVLMLSPGISIESSEKYALAINPAITLSGADTDIAPQTFALGFSFTTFWN